MRFEIYLEFVNAGLNQINKWINEPYSRSCENNRGP